MSRFSLLMMVVLARFIFCAAIDEALRAPHKRPRKVDVEEAAQVNLERPDGHFPVRRETKLQGEALTIDATGRVKVDESNLEATHFENINMSEHGFVRREKQHHSPAAFIRTHGTDGVQQIQEGSEGEGPSQAGASIDAATAAIVTGMTIVKYSMRAGPATNSVSVPGKLNSVPLYIIDIIAMPQENSVAVHALETEAFAGIRDRGYLSSLSSVNEGRGGSVEAELTKLPMSFLSSQAEHVFNCAVLKRGGGGSQVLMCRVNGVDIRNELLEAQRTNTEFKIQLGSDVVDLSPRSLSSGSVAHNVTRRYAGSPNVPFSTSAVIPLYGKTPPYLSETMMFYKLAGLSHVYLGLFDLEKPGEVQRQLEPFISAGFVSIMDSDRWPGVRPTVVGHAGSYHNISAGNGLETNVVTWKTLLNDWALYHAKSWDDLLIVHDYDELMVPIDGGTIPNVLKEVFEHTRSSDTRVQSLSDLCFFNICPLVTFSGGVARQGVSRAQDFPFMDGGNASFKRSATNVAADIKLNRNVRCRKGGYRIMYDKSIAVVQSTYMTGVHIPGACSAQRRDGLLVGYPRSPHVEVPREAGLVVQHFLELLASRPESVLTGSTVSSVFTQLWAPRLKAMTN